MSDYRHDNHLVDAELQSTAHISHFGALKTSPVIPVLKGNFAGSSLDTSLWDSTTANGGSITVEDGVGKLSCGTNSAGSSKLFSTSAGRFEAGQVTVYQSGVYAGRGLANNIRRWGVMTSDEQDGLFFEWNGTDFRVVARKGGTDTAVSKASFNGDKHFSPRETNNTFRIFFSAGRAIFCRAQSGRVVRLHTMTRGDLPLVNDLDMCLYYENTNSGNTTDVEMRIRGASSSVFGELSRYNAGGALLTANFGAEVALGVVSKHEGANLEGRNGDIDTTSTPEDIFLGSGTYAGFPTGAPETAEIFSSSANDTSAGTGARTVEIRGLASKTATEYTTETLTMNGTTAVTSTGTWYRINRVRVLTAGSNGANVGTLTVRHTTTTANIFAQVTADFGHSAVAALTVPASTTLLINRIRLALSRANGSAGSAQVVMQTRAVDSGSWQSVRIFELTQANAPNFALEVPLVIPAQTDIRFRCLSVSDNNTIITAFLDGIFVDD